jgi:glycosyltransferase involved in cell wall biosynthesis
MLPARGDAPRLRVAVFGLDHLARKNLWQLAGLNAHGYTFDVFANSPPRGERIVIPDGNTSTLLMPAFRARMHQVAAYLRRHARVLHHVEVYPGGRFAALYVLLARALGVPVLAVERGDLINRPRHGPLTRASTLVAYRGAHAVWYREPYQERELRRLGVRRLFFLPNAGPREAPPVEPAARDLDFVWVNRLVKERKSAWLIDALHDPAFDGTRNALAGFLDGETADREIVRNQAHARASAPANLELIPFCAPQPLYRRARFFVLPSDVVFCNNALLEAMAAGVVPLVSDVEGADRIVEHGVNGLLFPHAPEGLREAMLAALRIPPAEYARMSAAAVAKVRTDFSSTAWAERLAREYARLRNGAREST